MVKTGNKQDKFVQCVKEQYPGRALGHEAWSIGANKPGATADPFGKEENCGLA